MAETNWYGGGMDLLSGAMNGYFAFEERKQGLELQEAQIDQARMQNAISVDQQVNEQIADKQGRNDGGGLGISTNTLLLAGGGLVTVVALLMLVKN